MKIYIFIAYIFFNISLISGQTTQGEIGYIMRQHLELSSDIIERETMLLFTDIKSLYTYKDEPKQNAVKKSEDGMSYELVEYDIDTTKKVFYKNLKNDLLVFRNTVYKTPYIIEEPIPKIDWKLTSEKKEILNYPCQKAIGEFRGRTYHAWFTDKIPVSTGPYKFNGLPGLILEIQDTEKEISFTAFSVKNRTISTELLPPNNGEKVSSLTYFKKLRDIGKEIEAEAKKEQLKIMAKFERGDVIPGSFVSVNTEDWDYIERTHELDNK
ncbi:GLPGLI family protein [Aquimarina sp. MAR_2010_214]|uniref:GLPGLI family protein n=1 Tax=Aquimarina sp. MAR_2010_214 TaxID=1250026 RepID=UPI000C70EF74|nr:GLPGLI family protein [Aquimarina sp. MAR_2010_214]PKV52826.1 GLPGLI family protein [Aquimarina sp. MAR_2010_214]